MKRFISIALALCLTVLSMGAVAAADGAIRVGGVCTADSVQVGDQFLVQVMIDGAHNGYLTYSVAGDFDPEMAELIAPVYKDDGFSIVYNDFSNDDGHFAFDAADFSLNGSYDNLICSLLFRAKKAGNFKLAFGGAGDRDPLKVGVLGSAGMYRVEVSDFNIEITENSGRDNMVIIEERKPLTPYDDMDGHSWAQIAVGALSQLGILAGIADGESFEPDKSVTRGEFVAMLVRAAKLTGGGEQFSDVAADYPYAAEISIAKKKGIALGDGDGRFEPEATVTRQDISAFVYRTLHYLDKMDEAPFEVLADFPDSGEISDYAVPTMASVVRAKLMQGDDLGFLHPADNMTRAEAAVLIERTIVHIRLVL